MTTTLTELIWLQETFKKCSQLPVQGEKKSFLTLLNSSGPNQLET